MVLIFFFFSTFVHVSGGVDLIAALREDELLKDNKDIIFGLQQMELVLRYCELFGVLDKVRNTSFSITESGRPFVHFDGFFFRKYVRFFFVGCLRLEFS